MGASRAENLSLFENPTFDGRVKNKIITYGGKDMWWINEHNIALPMKEAVEALGAELGA